MDSVSGIESQIDSDVIFHKPLNNGFIAFCNEYVYVVRDKDESFQFEKMRLDKVEHTVVKEKHTYNGNRYDEETAENMADSRRTYTEIRLSLPKESIVITVQESPHEVTLGLVKFDIP